MPNVDSLEIDKFAKLAHHWWDPSGKFKTLHDINPLRVDYIRRHCTLTEKKVLDVGCGGGILSEAMDSSGAHVTGIDLGEKAIRIAKLHQLESGSSVRYDVLAVETLARQEPLSFDIVTCMEMLEHVPDPASIVHSCAQLVKSDGTVFFSTLNRHPKAYTLAILGAEYLLGMLPRGTHDYSRFIRPSELVFWCRQAGLELIDLCGVHYHPLTQTYTLGHDVSVNYLMATRKQ
ncbi:MAG: bifunctional 2-polyprenyl-6-hydroxyphenol methylase/3-demethylubiquinol 3-O-methyltransferase UbiG [Proteobacteria bacterium]|nr:bifunctional 2-polyprenyl-6-hydroxyphenol methylase/3-demethylubiquinol 3-O-methyltransferase UbiG [Pseudomonadota bacterium]MDE3207464.1 bifunctional 2-polyprenyl-6-hydroxyphenol methylase/3-demethylubiquinol 3-O-methyltransferase UbiG [Pseudomonadota bacterium]